MRKSIWKRALSLVLSLAMLLTLVPAFDVLPEAEAAENRVIEDQGVNYITLPITIRDFAADGMLFEYNEVNATDTITVGSGETDRIGYAYYDNPSYWDAAAEGDYTGLRIYDYSTTSIFTTNDDGYAWYCVICDAYGNVTDVLPANTTKNDGTYDDAMQSGYFSVWVWLYDSDNYKVLSTVTEANKYNYRIGIYNNQLYIGNRIHYTSSWDVGTNDYRGIRYFDTTVVPTFDSEATGQYWTCIICDSNGYVLQVLENGTIKGDGTYTNAMAQDGAAFSLWAWHDSTNTASYTVLTEIAAKVDDYQITFVDTTAGNSILYVDGIGESRTYHQADTQAFGLLQTDANDYINCLADSTGAMSQIIYGSELFANGSWNTTTEITTPVKSNLYSSDDRTTPYATQDIYGARVRTNLVDKGLDKNGNPLYTPETVEFLAEFMQQIMAVPEQNADGTYNSYHVEGVKLYADDSEMSYVGPNAPEAVYDLADVLRLSVKNNALGDYTTAKTKFEARQLLYPHQATTWFEAAYYLLHFMWEDSPIDLMWDRAGQDGYGYPIDRYESMHLIETTNEDGEICYVFNARYDGTVYNYNQGQIFNTQLTNFTQAVNGSGALAYAYGNKLPVSRFDPLNANSAGANLGYGLSGNTYGDMVGASATQDWAEYYNETNYNLSLEGRAQFVYHQASDQYFKFTGDDDVYLYINGVRVLDIGGAHSISKVGISLNDVAEACGMVDGGTYTFDFFFLERHGTAANFGIETNIQLAEPSMNTYKTGYQNGANTGYNGAVNPNLHVGYSFELQNDGDAHIYNLTFDDKDIGVYFGWDAVQLYPTAFTEDQKSLYSIDDLYMIYWNAAGAITEYLRPGQVTEDIITKRLHEGLDPGERIGIFGFKYDITKAGTLKNGKTWAEDGTFLNTVYTTSTSDPDIYVAELHGMADWQVRKMALAFEPFHVYDWVNKDVSRDPATVCDWRTPKEVGLPFSDGVTVPKSKLIEYLAENGVTVPANAEIVRCTAAGYTEEYNQNPNVTVNTDGSITYKSTKTGLDTVYYKVQWTGNEYNDVVFNYDVYTYGTVNNIFVLDYGLKVELNTWQFGFFNNDVWEIDQNTKYDMLLTVEGLVNDKGEAITEKTGNYGKFTSREDARDELNGLSVVYEPTKIMNNVDTVLAKVVLMEKGETVPTIYNSVEMAQKVKVAPASVVYYEENFPGITYVEVGENNWLHYETEDQNGDSVAGEYQSPDQDSNYGSDPNYDEDLEGDLVESTTPSEGDSETNNVINPDGEPDETEKYLLDTAKLSTLQKSALNAMQKFLGVGGTDSNGSVYELQVNTTGEVMHFTFTGTGFEILSRTTDEQYAIIAVQVQRHKKDASGNPVYEADGVTPVYEVVKHKPVITESIGGDMYQVPIISFTGLEHGEYRVVVTAAGSTANATRVLYIDGIRIYGPLTKDEALEYYNPNEVNAEFLEIKQLVKQGKAAYFGVEKDGYLVSGISYAEDIKDNGLWRQIDNADEYMDNGPNNELYLNASGRRGNMVAFYLKPIENVPESARTIQIGAHRKVDPAADAYGYVRMTYGSTRDDIVEQINYEDISSGTEMYYTVHPEDLLEGKNGYLLMIGTNSSENEDFETLSLTNLKISGYTVEPMEDEIRKAIEGGGASEILAELRAIYEAMMAEPESQEEPETEEDTEDDTTEGEDTASEVPAAEETVIEAALPEEAEEGIEPEETETGETEAEETEAEVTEPEETVDDIAE